MLLCLPPSAVCSAEDPDCKGNLKATCVRGTTVSLSTALDSTSCDINSGNKVTFYEAGTSNAITTVDCPTTYPGSVTVDVRTTKGDLSCNNFTLTLGPPETECVTKPTACTGISLPCQLGDTSVSITEAMISAAGCATNGYIYTYNPGATVNCPGPGAAAKTVTVTAKEPVDKKECYNFIVTVTGALSGGDHMMHMLLRQQGVGCPIGMMCGATVSGPTNVVACPVAAGWCWGQALDNTEA